MEKRIITWREDVALLITRVIIGGVFITSGWMKMTHMHITVDSFSKLQIPEFLTYIVAYGEFIGGILLVIGLWTWIASAFLFITMTVAIYLFRENGFMAYLTPLVTASSLIATLGCGSGKYSVNNLIKKISEKKIKKDLINSI